MNWNLTGVITPCSVSTHRKLWAQVWASEGRTTSRIEKDICSTAAVAAHFAFIEYERFSDINRIVWAVARLKNIFRSKTSRTGNAVQIAALHLKEAENVIVRDVQKSIDGELMKSSNKGGRRGHYAILQ